MCGTRYIVLYRLGCEICEMMWRGECVVLVEDEGRGTSILIASIGNFVFFSIFRRFCVVLNLSLKDLNWKFMKEVYLETSLITTLPLTCLMNL